MDVDECRVLADIDRNDLISGTADSSVHVQCWCALFHTGSVSQQKAQDARQPCCLVFGDGIFTIVEYISVC